MAKSPRDEALLRLLDSGARVAVVTVTRRLAFTLGARVAELRAAAGSAVADTPPMQVLDDFIGDLARLLLAREVEAPALRGRSAKSGRVLLAPRAEQLLWEQIIRSDVVNDERELLDTSALALTAAEAWRRINLWGEPSWSGPLAQDVEHFARWLPRFRMRLEQGGFLTVAELPRLVADAIRDGALDAELPARLVLLGFEKDDAAATLLTDALRTRGVAIADRLDAAEAPAATVQAWCAATPADEIRRVAARIREILHADPELRVGVLAPDLGACGPALERVFEEELDPAGILDSGAAAVRRFDYAEAPALADYPLVASALDLLSIDGNRIAFETASRILLSEHPRESDAAAAEAGRIRRGEAEARLRRERGAVLKVAASRSSLAEALRSAGLESWSRRFTALLERIEAQKGERTSPSRWRGEFVARLEAAGWPGAIRGDVEGLLFRRWRDALDELAMLESVEASMSFREALSRLHAICAGVRVQPPASSRSVQVMTLLDAAGLDFDLIFVVGLTSTAFPPAPKPNPLLPVQWQRLQRGMPRVSVEAERDLAERVWQRVRQSAPTVIASWPVTGDSGEENSPSAFVAGSGVDEKAADRSEPWWLDSARKAPAREARPGDEVAAPLLRRGSQQILQQQSNCPFQAFANIRLGAEPLDAVESQPDRSRRGTLVHAALELAYKQIGSQAELLGLSDDNIVELARDAACEATQGKGQAEFFADAPDLEGATRIWLQEMVAAWMLYERDARETRWEVLDMERDEERSFPPGAADALSIRFRPDRIDRLEDGSLVILDFKTSATGKTASRWKGERPEELQLPLYLALLEQEGQRVSGIAFANLAARDKCELRGVAAEEHARFFKPPKEGFDETVERWREVLSSLAASYLAGNVAADPRKAAVCDSCGVPALCRIREQGPPGADDAEDEGE